MRNQRLLQLQPKDISKFVTLPKQILLSGNPVQHPTG